MENANGKESQCLCQDMGEACQHYIELKKQRNEDTVKNMKKLD